MMHSEIGASLIIGDASEEAFAWAEIRLTPEGEIRLTGRVTVNGQEV